MTDQTGPTPRRALPPRDEVADDVRTPEATPAWQPRRGASSAPGSEGPAASRAVTPIPPPAAVMPPTEAPAAGSGRRFSAVDLPADEDRPLPRRSALSPAATRARSPRTPDAPVEAAPPGRRRGRALVPLLVVLVVAALAVGGWLVARPFLGSPLPGSTPTPTIDPTAVYLLQAGDLDGVRESSWQAATTANAVTASTPTPRCLTPVGELQVKPASTLVRTFSPTAGAAAGILHQVETYASPQDATQAYAARMAQLGDCERNTAWVEAGRTVTGLADESAGSTVVLQAAQPEYHTILVTRTGARLNVVDATQAESALAAEALAPALRAVSGRQCADGGTCPAEVAVTDGVPPATDPPGFLAGVDLPRITAGSGTWRGTPVATSVGTTGSRCEAVDLTKAPNASAQQQRTLVLQDDASAPQGFGVDEVVYTFATPEEANAFVGTLAGNVDGCAGRTATAQVARSGELTGPGTGAAWVITQKVDQAESTARFRVAVLAAGNHVVYLMANPSDQFDFADAAWHGVALRAAQRLTQLP